MLLNVQQRPSRRGLRRFKTHWASGQGDRDREKEACLAPPRFLLEAIPHAVRGLTDGQELSHVPALQGAIKIAFQHPACQPEAAVSDFELHNAKSIKVADAMQAHVSSPTCQLRFLSSMPRAKSSVRVQVGDQPHSWKAWARIRKLVPACGSKGSVRTQGFHQRGAG